MPKPPERRNPFSHKKTGASPKSRLSALRKKHPQPSKAYFGFISRELQKRGIIQHRALKFAEHMQSFFYPEGIKATSPERFKEFKSINPSTNIDGFLDHAAQALKKNASKGTKLNHDIALSIYTEAHAHAVETMPALREPEEVPFPTVKKQKHVLTFQEFLLRGSLSHQEVNEYEAFMREHLSELAGLTILTPAQKAVLVFDVLGLSVGSFSSLLVNAKTILKEKKLTRVIPSEKDIHFLANEFFIAKMHRINEQLMKVSVETYTLSVVTTYFRTVSLHSKLSALIASLNEHDAALLLAHLFNIPIAENVKSEQITLLKRLKIKELRIDKGDLQQKAIRTLDTL